MGKGGKNQQPDPKKRKPQPQSEQSQEDDQPDVQEEGQEQDQIDYFDPEISDRDQQLLQRINQEIIDTNQPLKFTWAAIFKLKQEQKALNEKMEQQMLQIQRKYDQLKNPIWHKISRVASGQVLEKQLYTNHQMTKGLNINKNKPQAIPGFWKVALQSVGFVQTQQDAQILQHCAKLQCNTQRIGQGESYEQKITVLFKFNQNNIITNKELNIKVNRKGQQQFTKDVSKINYHKQVQAQQGSMFGKMFDPEISDQQLYTICEDLQRAYNNSVFYYFYEGKIDDNENELEGQGDQEQAQDEEQQDQDQQSPKQKSKPQKNRNNKKDAKQPPTQMQKPECKQQ